MQLFKSLLSFDKSAHPEVHKPKVVDRLDTVRLDANGFEVKLLGHFKLALDKQAVAFVDKCLCVVTN